MILMFEFINSLVVFEIGLKKNRTLIYAKIF